MTITDLSVQFSEFDFPNDTFAAPRHHTFSYKTNHSVNADCNDCGQGTESAGFDESSSRAVAAWMKRHEAGE